MIHGIRATSRQRLGRNYERLYADLETMSMEGLLDLYRMVREFDQQLTVERKEGRKDVVIRGRFP
jgi:hypothetical protein